MGWAAKLMPVPRDLSSSCGTCVRWSGPKTRDQLFSEAACLDEDVEQIVRIEENGYTSVYKQE